MYSFFGNLDKPFLLKIYIVEKVCPAMPETLPRGQILMYLAMPGCARPDLVTSVGHFHWKRAMLSKIQVGGLPPTNFQGSICTPKLHTSGISTWSFREEMIFFVWLKVHKRCALCLDDQDVVLRYHYVKIGQMEWFFLLDESDPFQNVLIHREKC